MSATARTVHQKPPTCAGCPLEHRGYGYVPGSGPVAAPITILAEAPGYDEVALGQPMVGAAGGMLSRILTRALRSRSHYRIENTLRCCPPQYEIHSSWAGAAASHCAQHSSPTLSQSPVIFAMGATAIRQALGFWDWDVKHLVENFHGTVHQLPSGQFVVCSYHPSFLQRGASNLIGTVIDDLAVAHEVAEGRWVRDPITPVIDPHPEWFNQVYVPQYLAMVRQDPSYWLAADVETPDKAKGKSEDELDESDASFQILRYNFAYHPDEGITVPNEEPWRPGIQALLEAARITLWWNGEYDLRRIASAGLRIPGECWDGMWLWHHYRSDVPKGLGFAAPSCSRHGAWKHLFLSAPAEYAAYDGPQTYRTVAGTVEGLQRRGQWDVAYRHTVQLLQEVLKPAARLGILVDRPALDAFETKLTDTARQQLADLQELVPPEDRPLTGGTKHVGLTRPPQGPHPDATTVKADGTPKADAADADPLKVALYAAHAKVEEHCVLRKVLVCRTCGESQVVAKHRCKGKYPDPPAVELCEIPVQRWFWREPFNPDAPQQVLDYIQRKRHVPGRNKKTKNPTADKETLKRLAATTKDPFYSTLLGYRAVGKIRGTYAIGVRKRLDPQQRFHPTPTLKPSTLRNSYVAPNIQNVTTDNRLAGGEENAAAGFRKCIVAGPGCHLYEFDFSGIEARLVGWFARDMAYYRLSGLGVHAYLASHLIGQPADLRWSDTDLVEYFARIKKQFKVPYDMAKRTVHGNGYGMTAKGMFLMFPDLYPTEKAAKGVQDLYFSLAPAVPAWQNATRLRAHEQTYLGGPPRPGFDVLSDPNAHPYGYRHDFWAVVLYRPVGPQAVRRLEAERVPVVEFNGRPFAAVQGEDAKRTLAFYPQSTAAGILKEVLLTLFTDPDHPSYIGDAYFGQTPLRAPIHDSLLLEIPDAVAARTLERVYREMLRPIEEMPLPMDWRSQYGTHLTVGVEGKRGLNWDAMEKLPTPGLADLGLLNEALPIVNDRTYWPAMDEEQEDVEELAGIRLGLGIPAADRVPVVSWT